MAEWKYSNKRTPQIFVTEARVHEDGYTVYKITCKILRDERNIQSFEYFNESVIWKRYSDIKALHSVLTILHRKLYLSGTVPEFAKSKVFGRFDKNVVEERRQSAQKLFDFVCTHPPLHRSNFFFNFFKNSKSLGKPEEINHLKQKPLNPEKFAKPVGNDIDGSPAHLSEHDLETFDPYYTKEFIRATSVNQDEDWLDVIKKEISPTLVKTGESSAQYRKDIEADDSDLFNELKIEVKDSEMTDYYNRIKLTNGDKTQNENNHKLNVNDEEAREQHRKSSKASAYLNQVMKNISNPEEASASNEETFNNASVSDITTATTQSETAKDSILSGSNSLAELWKYLKDDSDDSRGAYIMQANQQISFARKAEIKESYEEAFGHYKTAINTLLQGVQDDTDEQRLQAVRRKTAIYLQRAEDLHANYLQEKSEPKMIWQPGDKTKTSASKPIPYHVGGVRKGRGTSSPIPSIPSPRHSSTDLLCYKVLGTVGKVLLVLDSNKNQTYVMKVIPKSFRPRKVRGVIPTNVPFMVRLYRYYSTDNAIYLLLEYAQGGKLWDQLGSYFKSAKEKQTNKTGSMKRSKTFTPETTKVENGPCDDETINETSATEIANTSSKQCAVKRTPSVLSWDTPVNAISLEIGEDTNKDSFNASDAINYNIIAASDTMFTVGDDEDEANDSCNDSDLSDSEVHPDLLSEQDMSAVFIVCDTDAKQNTQQTLQQNDQNKLSSSPNALSPGPSSPCLSLNSSFEAGNDTQDANSVSTPVISRMVDEHGVSSVDAISLFRTHSRTRSVDLASVKSVDEASVSLNTVPEHSADSDNVFHSSVPKRISSIFEKMDEANEKLADYRLPEETVKLWAAELVVAVGTLHSVGILCRDLNPENLMLSEDGHLRLTYFGKWRQVERKYSSDKAVYGMYTAPECHSVEDKKTEACDWWSVGSLLYEIITAKSLLLSHPCGIDSHTILDLPEDTSPEAKSLLKGLLQVNPRERLGYGSKNLDDIMEHPYFDDIEWDALIENYSAR